MQELEKILEEIKKMIEGNKVIELNGDGTVNRCIIDVASAWDSIKAIIHDHINDGWIPVEERLPEEKVNPVSRDFYEYQVTANFGFGTDVRSYKFGNGHWWSGPGIVDQYVIAWRPLPEPYRPERCGGE